LFLRGKLHRWNLWLLRELREGLLFLSQRDDFSILVGMGDFGLVEASIVGTTWRGTKVEEDTAIVG
jgi:hypothetical protein